MPWTPVFGGDGALEDFEDGDLSGYGGDTDVYTVQQSTVLEGDNTLQADLPPGEVSWISAPNISVDNETTYRWTIQSQSDEAAFSAVLGTQDTSNIDGYALDIRWFDNSVVLANVINGNYSEMRRDNLSAGRDLQTDQPYTIEFSWMEDTLTGRLFDATGYEVTVLTVQDNTFAAGGIGWRGYNDGSGDATVYADYLHELRRDRPNI